MSQYIFLQVKEVIKETADAVTIVFTKPTLIQSYKSGQFLTFIMEIGGEKLRRSYSLSSSPHSDQDWAVSVKKVEGGKMSTHLVEKVKTGDIIEVMAPAGVFTYEPVPSNTSDIVLIGGGSGITPLYSVIGSALAVEKNSRVYLVYSNRDENSVMLKSGLEKYKTNYPDRFKMVEVYSKPKQAVNGISGRLDKNKIKQIIEGFKTINISKALYFVCGPHGMMEEAFQALDLLKVPKDNIRKESFTSGLPVDNTAGEINPSDGPKVVSIKYGRSLHKVNVAAGQTILEAALDQDIDLPYSCQSGMCTACMGKCKTGQVKMSDPDGLSENEIKQGFVLTCVGRPLTDDVLIEID
jgi:ring-1,2-phenylacetyl-CoA epoxidase subunit PaaE